MKHTLAMILSIASAVAIAGCGAQSQPGAQGSAQEAPAAAAGAVDPHNPLSQVKTGMTKKQVRDLVGQPSDENSYESGKRWIPWYYGNDVRRTSWYYKGQGQVVFADGNVFGAGSGGEVVDVIVDSNESGVAR